VPRSRHTATLLPSGKVLLTGGGFGGTEASVSAELYDPATETFTTTGRMAVGHWGHTATLLPSGKVLVAGGPQAGTLVELYDPDTGTFAPAGNMTAIRLDHTATLLLDGRVLIVGGYDLDHEQLTSAELGTNSSSDSWLVWLPIILK